MPIRVSDEEAIPIPQPAFVPAGALAERTLGVVQPQPLEVEFPPKVLFDLEPVSQGANANLCWAACAQMVLNLKGFPVRACELANRMLNTNNHLGNNFCCVNPLSASCDQALDANRVEALYRLTPWQLNPRRHFAPNDPVVDLKTIKEEIRDDRPVEVGIQWRNATEKHLIIVYGHDGADMLFVLDPWPTSGRGHLRYKKLINSYQSTGDWILTLTNLG